MVDNSIPDENQNYIAVPEKDDRVPSAWNSTSYPHCLSKGVHELFEEQAALNPDTVAVSGDDGQLTFRELNERANQLARALIKRGVEPNTFVGLCVERSLEMMIGIYGILKAGGAYVPLDPVYPQERLAYMLETAKIRVLLTQDRLVEIFDDDSGVDFIRLDTEWPIISQEDGTNFGSIATPDNMIYLIFTSGSTGKPKGAAVYHRNFTNLLLWFVTEFGITASDCNLLVSSLSFDLTQKNLYAPMIKGGRLQLAPSGPYDPRRLSRLIQEKGVSLINCTPSAFYPMIEPFSEEVVERMSSLRIAFLGGEPISIPRLRSWMTHPSCQSEVANTYGPTECTDICGAYRMTRDNMDRYNFVPLGRPVHNVQLVIVNSEFKVCPIGESGELCIAGAGIGAGYINDPEMTAAKFISNPFEKIAGTTLYRTGDQARWLPDGVIEFLGRLDHQVKIRGFRVELHEIEAVLDAHPEVREAVVVVKKGPGGDESARLVCYLMPPQDSKVDVSEIKAYLADQLPDYMVPGTFHVLSELPLSPNGKVDRTALQNAPEPDQASVKRPEAAVKNSLEQQIQQIWLDVLRLAQVSLDQNFFDVGGNSIQLAQVHARLLMLVEHEFPITDLFSHTTVRETTTFLAKDLKHDTLITNLDKPAHVKPELVITAEKLQIEPDEHPYAQAGLKDIAIIGMAGRFPGAANVDQFWQNLVNGVETISRFSEDELEFSAASPDARAQGQSFIRARAILEDVDQFDAAFFGIFPREAEIMDPQHRLFLECAWEALECGAYDPDRYPGLIGVYAGLSLNTYLLYNLCADHNFAANFAGNYQVGQYQVMLGNDKDFMPTRVSYKLNLRGPSISIQTACSTSLVAVCQACTGLLNRDSDMALAGGVSITFPQKRDYLYQEGAMVSADGTCRVFDADAQGTVFGHGVAVVLLKRLADALSDGDNVLAVIKGTALNNDGSAKIGYAAPSVNAQAEVIAKAQAAAGVHPETVSFIESHGTATPLGDPIEVAALTQAFRGAGAKRNGYCAIGTCKTNIGHIDVAAGATGLIKTVLQLQHEKIPPLLHFKTPNPQIDFENTPFSPVRKLLDWKRDGGPRRAGVSAFGVGGTNAHVVVEEAPPSSQTSPSRSQQLLVLSAQTENALNAMSANLAAHIEKHPEINMADVAFTLQNGRKLFDHRRTAVTSNAAQAAEQLRSLEPKTVFTAKVMPQEPSVVFIFPGQGAQYLGMGRALYKEEAVFRKQLDRCADILQGHLDLDLRSVLYPDTAVPLSAETQINQTWLAQPAIFVIEYALARLWMSWGVKPSVLIGHSIGEYVAAVIAETFTLEDALSLLSERARLMQDLPAGSMLSVRMSENEIKPLLPEGAAIAAVNSPMLCVVSGAHDQLLELNEKLEAENIATRFLHTSHAFHSSIMEPMLPEFAAIARQTTYQPPKMPWVSTSTGHWIGADDLVDGNYWVRQVRHTVRFADALEPVIGDPQNILLEVGPGQTLSQLARQHAKKTADTKIVASLGPVGEPERDQSALLAALGRLWAAGVAVKWETLYTHEKRRRMPLPTYPFERKRFWIEPNTVDSPVKHSVESAGQSAIVAQRIEDTDMQTKNQTEQVAEIAAAPPRKDRLINDLRELFASYSGADHSQTDPDESFMDLGLDSLLLTQVSQGVLKRFKQKVTFRQLLGDLDTLESLAGYLDGKMPPEAPPQPASKPTPVGAAKIETSGDSRTAVLSETINSISLPSSQDGNLMVSVIQQQMAIMNQQLELLRRGGGAESGPVTVPEMVPPASSTSREPVVTAVNLEQKSHFGPFKPIDKGASGGLTQRQQGALEELIGRYNRRTAKSKVLAQQHRSHFSDPRAAGNFRQLWKEMVYPIACAKSKGARIWDIDSNEYIDVTMGFGANYLGHSPDFVLQAVKEQMELGLEIGPQSPIAGEVARLLCEFTGMDRATFCNTGSEAVMAAIRVARTVTGRQKIVYFYGDYHGIFDEVLGRPATCDGMPGAMPIAPGVPHLANVIILEYGNAASLDTIQKHADDISAVIVEPVQSRHPELQPRDFLRELRRLTQEKDIALILDEIITGFRVAPGGAQEYFGVKADMATYGKVIGGGMPIGVLAGSDTYMDALDGGFWQYGDDSSPPTGVTFFAGTFVRHPLAMAAAHAVLTYLMEAGPALQEQANKVTARFTDKVNDFFNKRHLPMKLQTFSAMFYYDFHPDLKFASLLFYYLRDRGVHIWEGRVGHLSVAHTDQDMDLVLQAFEESVDEMQSGGFLPDSDTEPFLGTHAPHLWKGPFQQANRDPWMPIGSLWLKRSQKCGLVRR